ncbi:MAG: class I SAM-dependent methyltransferase, partial [Aestuariivirgaceae bacterium]
YAERGPDKQDLAHLKRFISELPPQARVCDLGSGNGWASVVLRDAGFDVVPVDGSAGLAAEAKARHGLDVRVMTFEEFSFDNEFDGLWAAWSLHHAKRAAFPDLLARVGTAVRPGGIVFISIKGGSGERRDRLDRFYAYYEMDELLGLIEERIGADVLLRESRDGEGFDGSRTPIHLLMIRKRAVNAPTRQDP